MSDELKPCPMCGSADLFICPDEYGSGGQHVLPYRVGCKCCGLELYHLAGDSEESAAAQWNARADSPDLAILRAQLADAVRDRDAAVRQTLITETALEDACRLISGGVLRAAGCHVSEGADTPQWFVDRAYIARNALEKTR